MVVRVALIFASFGGFAARVCHGSSSAAALDYHNPINSAREINRCLTCARLAMTRRNSNARTASRVLVEAIADKPSARS